MKVHFITVGGKDLAIAMAKPYKKVPLDEWKILCDHFASQEFEKVFSQNSENRLKQLYAPGQGSLSITGHIHKEAEMVASREKALTLAQAQAHETIDPTDLANLSSSAEFVVGPPPIDEYAIMTQSLGTHSRW
ncbi:Metallo-dependent phosphatase-like [Parasponia andersonii]|uniref:Metallo-dependent phosphatase-like n=1 Tax=Parasponia andersonii TaxID=3476 RepID=A0A2P5B7D0_PARAD|nr:Metallo-dependent phosphatase-like [Parasponia andersonii]